MREFDTDKYDHGFIDFYEPYFNNLQDVKHVLEIGVYNGGSLKYLSSKFKNAKIYGIDIENKEQYDSDRIKTYIVNQEDREDLNNFLEKANVEFDIILDDGGHTMKQQQVSFGTLFKKLKKGGMYILEDLHTSRLEQLGTIHKDDLITSLDMLYTIKYTNNIISNHILEEEKEYIKKNLDDIIIWTRTPEYNQSVTSIIKKKNLKTNFDIGITTFSLRFDFLNDLVKKIRGLNVQNNIYITINGEKEGNFNEDYRKKVLELCLNYENIYPIFFTEIRGLSKMWNTLSIHSTKNDILILNDDIDVSTDNLFRVVSSHIESSEYFGLSIFNNTFSFFVINKNLLDSIGYFDERLIGFGEEDGDIMFRLHKLLGKRVNRLNVSGLNNIISDIRHEEIKNGIGKYSFFNRDFIFNEKYFCEGDIYYFPESIDCTQKLEDKNQYPYEKFFQENKKRLWR
jgi:hypothetical protein